MMITNTSANTLGPRAAGSIASRDAGGYSTGHAWPGCARPATAYRSYKTMDWLYRAMVTPTTVTTTKGHHEPSATKRCRIPALVAPTVFDAVTFLEGLTQLPVFCQRRL